MNSPLPIKLLLKLICLAFIYFYAMFFFLGLLLWGYFGSGAGASSEKALLCGKIAIYFVVFPPILYFAFKLVRYRKEGKIDVSYSYLIAGLLYTLFVVINHLMGFLGS